MAQIHNSKLTKELIDGAKIQTSHDSVPSQIAEKVVPVMEVNPKLLRTCNIVRQAETSASGTTNVYGTPTEKDFYLVGYCLSMEKDGASDCLSLDLRATIGGVIQRIAQINGITLTAQQKTITGSFPTPIKIDRGTNVAMVGTKTVGTLTKSICIVGFLVDD